jgi:hypothetical protein
MLDQQVSQHLSGVKLTRQNPICAKSDLKSTLLSREISQNVQETMKSYTATKGGSNKQSKQNARFGQTNTTEIRNNNNGLCPNS